MKHNRETWRANRNCKLHKANLSGSLQRIPSCFNLHFNRFNGFIFKAEKPFENVCAIEAFSVVVDEYSTDAAIRSLAKGSLRCILHLDAKQSIDTSKSGNGRHV